MSLGLVGVVALIVVSYVLFSGSALPTRWPGPLVIVSCLAMSGLFIGLKASVLRACCAQSGVSIGRGRAARLICEGVAIECVSWPGKLWADGYRVRMLGDGQLRDRIRALVLFRCVTILAVLIGVSFAGAAVEGVSGLDVAALAGVALLGAVLFLIRNRRRIPDERVRWTRGLIGPTALALGAAVTDAAAASLIAWSLAGVDPLLFGVCFMVCGVFASASGLPLGAGVLDAAGWLVLNALFGVDAGTAAAVVLIHRLLGPVLTLLIGSVCLVTRALPIAQARAAQARPMAANLAGARRAAGFSLVELVMVIMIIGVISAIAIPRLSFGSDQAILAKAKELENNLEKCVVLYVKEYGRMPKTFYNWVGLSEDATDRNYINIGSLRSLLADPGEDMMINETTLRMEFRSGLKVDYVIDSGGIITTTYTQPSD